MKVYRLSRKKHSYKLSGKGAAKSGNRWNSKGIEIIYCADSRALAMAELTVHLTVATLPSDYMMLEINIPETISIELLEESDLPDEWNIFPHSVSTQSIGDNFIDSKKVCVLKVPSAVVKGDFNYLINPYYSDFKGIKITKVDSFPFDKRMFK